MFQWCYPLIFHNIVFIYTVNKYVQLASEKQARGNSHGLGCRERGPRGRKHAQYDHNPLRAATHERECMGAPTLSHFATVVHEVDIFPAIKSFEYHDESDKISDNLSYKASYEVLPSAQSRTSCKGNLCPTTFPSISIADDMSKLQFITSSLFIVKRLAVNSTRRLSQLIIWNFEASATQYRAVRNQKSLEIGHAGSALERIVSGILCNLLHITSAYCPYWVADAPARRLEPLPYISLFDFVDMVFFIFILFYLGLATSPRSPPPWKVFKWTSQDDTIFSYFSGPYSYIRPRSKCAKLHKPTPAKLSNFNRTPSHPTTRTISSVGLMLLMHVGTHEGTCRGEEFHALFTRRGMLRG